MKIAFIGLGIMGSRMAAHLIEGNEVTVWNRTKSKADELVAAGAKWVDTPKAAGAGQDVIITMVADPVAVEEVAFGPDGFCSVAPKNTLWMDCSTVSPKFSKSTALRVKDHGLRYLEAPVSGSRPHAKNAELAFLVGGNSADLEYVRPLIEKMGKKITHLGDIGSASTMKLILNQFAATMLASFAESINAGTKLGLDKDAIIDFIIGSSLAPPYLGFKAECMRTGSYDADFPLHLMQKDLQLMNESAYSVKAKMPISSASREAYMAAVSQGLGDFDMTAILQYMED